MVKLDIGLNKFTSNGVSDLFNRASDAFSSVKELDLQDNNLNADCVGNIVVSLEHTSCRSLNSLVLSNNHLGVSGILALERATLAGVFINLQDLQIAHTLTTDADINSALLTTFTTAIATHCPLLERIEISYNVLCIPGGCALGEAFLRLTNDRPVIFLMSDDTFLGGRPIDGLVNSMISSSERYNVCCQEIFPEDPISCQIPRHGLSLNRNALGYDGLMAVFRLLRSNLFQVSGIYIADVGLPCLTDAEHLEDSNSYIITGEMLCMLPFPQNDSVEYLLVDSNNLSQKMLHLLVGLLRLCQSVIFLSSDRCHLTSEDLIQILDQMKSTRASGITACRKLKSWSLSGNNIDDVGVASLIDCLSDLFPCLKSVSLDRNPVSSEMKKRLKECLKINNEVSNIFHRKVQNLDNRSD